MKVDGSLVELSLLPPISWPTGEAGALVVVVLLASARLKPLVSMAGSWLVDKGAAVVVEGAATKGSSSGRSKACTNKRIELSGREFGE